MTTQVHTSTEHLGTTATRTAGPSLDAVLEALRPSLMGARLSTALGLREETCHVLDAKYEPQSKAVVLYRLGRELVRGDLLCAETAATSQSALVPPGLSVSTFPDDPDLPSLRQVMDPSRLGSVLADHLEWPTRATRHRLRRRCRVQLLRYRPGKRATVLVGLGQRRAACVAKVYHDPDKAAAVAREAPVLTALSTSSRTLQVAASLGHLPELGVVVQSVVPGSSLHDLLGGPRGGGAGLSDAVARAARALAELHQGSIEGARRRVLDKELHRFVLRAARVASVDARSGARLAGLADRLLELHPQLPAGPEGLVHGDCKPSQFLVTDNQVFLVDLDHCGWSDQLSDVGTFVASLRQLALSEPGSSAGRAARLSQLTGLGRHFVDTYTGGRYDLGLAARIRWHEAVALERKALRAFARAPLSRLPMTLADEGHRCLDTLMRSPV